MLLVNVIVPPTQSDDGPVIGPGVVTTVTILVTKQPEEPAYVIVDVPVDMAVSMPVEEPIVATEVVPLLHVPPGVMLLNVTTPPVQIVPDPSIDVGEGITVTVVLTLQPDAE